MPPLKQVRYSNEQTYFGVKLFSDSYLTEKDAKHIFLRDFRHHTDLKVGEFYEKNKK